ncbi:MAG: TIGR04211 family SH3 domain-containing protein [Gammaproteobacteria bacterium]|nr:TIGR04211 family SH3 domain-containing protein [Gammaproteobacteria bacterium]
MTKKILTLLLVLTPLTAIAETLYVSDTLRVGIRTEPGNNVPSIAVVKSGAAVEVLDRKGSYIQVRTKSGVEGWVKSAYFSRKAPSAKLLNDAMTKISTLEKEINSLNKEQAKQATITTDPSLTNKMTALEKNNQILKSEIHALKTKPGMDINNRLPFKNFDENTLYIALGTLIVLFSLGFLFGVKWHKSQVAKRLGGMII